MSLISIEYYIFLIITSFFYYITPIKIRWITLLLASLYFFMQNSSVMLLFTTLFMVMIAYSSTMKLTSNTNKVLSTEDEQKKLKIQKDSQKIVTSSIIIEAFLLIGLQNNSFFIESTNLYYKFMGIDTQLNYLKWVTPLGMSYFTLMLIGYILDVHWKTIEVQRNPIKLTLYTMFFPQLVSGPITRYKEVNENLFKGNKFDHNQIELGTQRILWGLFKKLVVAERLSVVISTIVTDYNDYVGSYIMIAVFAYTIQVYTDFSASMDIVLGSAQILGVKLPENFSNPIFSQDLSEWWRKWHITLGSWLKDYILYPTLKSSRMQKIAKASKEKYGKKVGKKIPTYIGMFITWFLVGFWHGGTWNYILGSGLFFFLMIVGGMILEPLFTKIMKTFQINTNCFSWRFFCSLRTYILFSCAVFWGRAGSVTAGMDMTKLVLSNFDFPQLFNESQILALGLDEKDKNVLFISLGVMLLIEVLQSKFKIREKISEQNMLFRWMLWFILIFSTLIFGFYGPGYDPADFIYGGF